MNILIFSPLYYIQGRDDLKKDTNAIHYLAKYWADEHKVLVINTYLLYRKSLFERIQKGKIKYFLDDYSFEADGIKVYIVENLILTSGRFQHWNWWRLKKHIRKILAKEDFNPDIIVSHFPTYSYGFMNMFPDGIKKIAVLHESDVISAGESNSYIERIQSKYDAFFARSRKIRDYFLGRGLKNLNDEIIYSGAPNKPFSTARTWDHIESKPITVLYAGKFIPRKNIDWIIEAAASLSNKRIVLRIIGTGIENEKLQNMVRQLQLEEQVVFCGEMDRNDVLLEMSKADIFCMPSVKETFGLVYIEAMACGCVTIGTRNEGIDGIIIDGKNGYLISDKAELLALMDRLVMNTGQEEFKRISDNAVRTADLFSEENVSRRYLSLILGKGTQE